MRYRAVEIYPARRLPSIRALHCNGAMLPLHCNEGWSHGTIGSRPTAGISGIIKGGELKRFQFALPLETGIKVDYLCEALQCNRTELFSRLILEEWKRQGEPVRG